MQARQQTMSLKVGLMLLLVVLAAAATDAHAQDTEASTEYLIKAGFIYNFASLVQWPSTSFSQADSPIAQHRQISRRPHKKPLLRIGKTEDTAE